MIDVALVDDEALVRAGLAALIGAEPDLRVAGEATDGSEVVDLAKRVRLDIVLMDVRMPKVDGITATRTLLRTVDPAPKVIVLTTFEHDDAVYEALRAGASGFLLKRHTPQEILGAIRLVHAGDSLLFPAAIRHLATTNLRADSPAGRAVASLTDREAAILRQLATGRSNAEIAAHEHVSIETVKTHVSSILTKLQVRDRTQAVIAAYDAGLAPG